MRTNFTFGGSSASKPRSNVEIMMTPMIDVVFLLLVFFLATSSFQVVEKMLPSAVSAKESKAAGGKKNANPNQVMTDINDVVVRLKMDQNQKVFFEFNGQSLESLDPLSNLLQNVVQIRPDVPVIVDPDPKVPVGYAVQVYDIARRAGALRVYMATEG